MINLKSIVRGVILTMGITALLVLSDSSVFAEKEPLLKQKMKGLDGGIFTKDPTLLSNSYVRGLYGISPTWGAFESTEGAYNWSGIDNALAQAKAADKYIVIGLGPGVWTPNWVYVKYNLPSFTFNHKGKAYYSPYFWEKNYLDAYLKAVQALGNRYDKDANVIRIGVAGSTLIFGEMWIDTRLKAKIEGLGYTQAKYIAAWKYALDGFQKAFPNTPLKIDLNPIFGSLTPAKDIAQYEIANYKNQMVLIANNLGDKSLDNPILTQLYQLLSQYADDVMVGFQIGETNHMSDGPIWKRDRKQDPQVYAKVLQGLLDLNGRFLETAPERVLNPANAQTLERFLKELSRHKGKGESGK